MFPLVCSGKLGSVLGRVELILHSSELSPASVRQNGSTFRGVIVGPVVASLVVRY